MPATGPNAGGPETKRDLLPRLQLTLKPTVHLHVVRAAFEEVHFRAPEAADKVCVAVALRFKEAFQRGRGLICSNVEVSDKKERARGSFFPSGALSHEAWWWGGGFLLCCHIG